LSDSLYDTYQSVFTWRYGSPEMRKLFSEIHRRKLWRRVWVALAEAQSEYGLVSREELEDLKSRMEDVDIKRAQEIEREIKHDLMAEVKVYAEQCPVGGGKIHLGATSYDIEDNANALCFLKALDIILTRVVNCLYHFSEKIEKYKRLPCMGWTHLQPAEPTTLGYRLANYAQDLVLDVMVVERMKEVIGRGKGIKGAVGTSNSFKLLLKGRASPSELEEKIMQKLELKAFPITTQIYPRKADYILLSILAGIAQSLHRFCLDLRVLQSPPFGEWSEPIKEAQVGSSAMPFKRNPIKSERVCSLSRYVSILPEVAWRNAANSILERTLDDSANMRVIIPEAFLAVDECLMLVDELINGLRVYPQMIRKNLQRFGPFSGTEAVLMKLVERGMDRQKAHELLRVYAFKAWERVMKGEENPLLEMLKKDLLISSKLKEEEIEAALDVRSHIGDATERCELFLREWVNPILERYKEKIGRESRAVF